MKQDDAKTRLTNLELEVMRAVWGAGTAVTVREVAAVLNGERSRELAYTTVQTMLNILRDKGCVASVRGPGRAHLFHALRSRDEVTTSMVDDLVERLFDGQVQPLLHHLVDDQMDDGELKNLRAWIDSKLEDEGPKS